MSEGRIISRLAAIGIVAACLIAPLVWWERQLDTATSGGQVHFFNYDQYEYTVPALRYAAQRLQHGDVPLWAPEQLSGGPFLATQLHGILYPLHWLILALPLATFWRALLVGQALIAALGAYACARAFGARRSAALLGGVTYAFSGALTNVWIASMEPAVVSAAWLPWQLAFLRRTLSADGDWRVDAVGLGAASAFSVLGGHLPNLPIAVVLCGAYAVLHLLSQMRRAGAAARSVGRLALAAAIALGLSAVQLFPAYELLGRTLRSGAFASADAADPLANMLTPTSLLQGLANPLPSSLGLASPYFLGAATLGLALAAGVHRRNRRCAAALWILAALVTLIALGNHTPLFRWYFLLQGGSIRVPQRFFVASALCLATLAALGADSLSRARRLWPTLAGLLCLAITPFALNAAAGALDLEPDRLALRALAVGRAHAVWAAAFALPLLLPNRWSRSWLRPLLILAAAGLTAYEMYGSMHLKFSIPATDPEALHIPVDAAAFIRSQPGLPRVVTPIFTNLAEAPSQEVPVRVGMMEGLEAVSDYEPLVEREYTQLLWKLSDRGIGPQNAHLGPFLHEIQGTFPPLLAFLGVGFVLVPQAAVGAIHGPPPVYVDDEAVVYAVPDALPRVYVAADVRTAPTFETTLAAIETNLSWVLQHGALVDEKHPDLHGSEGSVVVRRHEPEAVELDATLSRPGLVVLLDRFDPFWRATIDGSAAPILRVNGVFRGVVAAAGEHRIRFVYRPWPVYLGALGTLLTIAAIMLAAVLRLRRG